MNPLIPIFHFYNGRGGGVYSVINNLICFQQCREIDNHVILLKTKDNCIAKAIPECKESVSFQLFLFKSSENYYHVCKRLSRLIPKNAVIVAHDWMELGMVTNLGLQNKVVFFLHGDYDYYYNLAVNHQASIDDFICVAQSIQQHLIKLLPNRISDIHYLRVPVPDLFSEKSPNVSIKIAFVGRGERAKGFHLLPQIAHALAENGLSAEWDIIGEVDTNCAVIKWPENCKISFNGTLPPNQVIERLQTADYILLPSFAEGMPVAIIEAMKLGVIPLVNNIKGGIQEFIKNGETGFVIDNNTIEFYVKNILDVESNPLLKKQLQQNVVNMANKYFEPKENTKEIEIIFLSNNINKKSALKMYCNRLDQKWIPNSITQIIRKLIYGG